MTVSHMIISFHANPEESLPSQRQRSALPLVTSGIMNSIQYLRFEGVMNDKEKKLSVHALIFSHLAQKAIMDYQPVPILQELSHTGELICSFSF